MLLKNLKPIDDSKPIIFHGEGELILSHNDAVFHIYEHEKIDMRNHHAINFSGMTFWKKIKYTYQVLKFIYKY